MDIVCKELFRFRVGFKFGFGVGFAVGFGVGFIAGSGVAMLAIRYLCNRQVSRVASTYMSLKLLRIQCTLSNYRPDPHALIK